MSEYILKATGKKLTSGDYIYYLLKNGEKILEGDAVDIDNHVRREMAEGDTYQEVYKTSESRVCTFAEMVSDWKKTDAFHRGEWLK